MSQAERCCNHRPRLDVAFVLPLSSTGVSERAIESFAGTGNPFAMGELAAGETVVDVGSGGGIDSLVAARMVGPTGKVIGIDMTTAMLEKARSATADSGIDNVEFREAYMEELPVPDAWADVVISNGVLNLTPDKQKALGEMFRVLRPGGRLQIADILVTRAVPDGAKRKIDLWTG
jgi:ubiquinone/menaquinone biosynthesis C-methylase UbiE